MWLALLNSPRTVDTLFTCLNRLRRTNDSFVGFDFVKDPQEELPGVLTSDTLAAPLDGVVLLADITLISAASIC